MCNVCFLWVVIVVLPTLVGGNGLQPNQTGIPCSYERSDEGLRIKCSHRSLTAIPGNLTKDATVFELNDNLLSKLSNRSFNGLPNLVSLNLQSNKVGDNIEKGAFCSLPKLNAIQLSNNGITSVPSDLFSKNRRLQKVNLANNKLESFPIDVLESLDTLQFVDVSDNLITNLHFQGLKTKNVSLFFNANRLSVLHEDDFLPLNDTRIEFLSFAANNLSSLQSKIFSHLSGVRKLALSANHFRNFSLLPFIGMTSLWKLTMENNDISTILPLASSFNETHLLPPVKVLYLEGNNIHTMPSGAFRGLNKLTELDIHQSRIKILQNDTFEGLDSLEILDLTGNPISYVASDMFNSFCPKLRSLILPTNHLSQLNPTQFAGIETLGRLNVARGLIRYIVIRPAGWSLPALQSLDISNNRISRLNKHSFYGMTNLTVLNISKNPINILENSIFASNDKLQILRLEHLQGFGSVWTPFTNLQNLNSLHLSHTPITQLTYKVFTGISNLHTLKMDDCALSCVSFWDPKMNVSVLSNLSTLKDLSLKDNNLNNLLPGTFRGLQSLEGLEMQSSNIKSLHEGIFMNLTTLVDLKLDGNSIKELTSQHFKELTSLKIISVKRNEIKEIPVDLFSGNPNLNHLTISHNHLTTIKEGTFLPKIALDVSYNPFSCICDLKWFVDWINMRTVDTLNPDQTNCSQASLAKFKNKPILTFDPSRVCGPKVVVYIISTFVIVTCIVMIIVAYQRRWLINYKCFHFKLLFIGKTGDCDPRNRLDYENDFNLVFDDDDEKWVREVLKPGIEERLLNFDRIVCGDDDLPLGMFYIDAITEVIENSFKTILIVSNRAVDNHGFISKLRLAVDHMNEVQLEKTILVFKEDIPDDHLPYLVRLFLSKNKPHLRWSEDEYGQRLMWEKLVQELEWNKKMNDVLPI
ncbi:toll-like receptor 3 [Lytechinus pictus]|uniref:toll-like receptor 3 n=1 Tax=Lytechinus pictus TaxID=7653 RepID=UPI0030B9E3D0